MTKNILIYAIFLVIAINGKISAANSSSTFRNSRSKSIHFSEKINPLLQWLTISKDDYKIRPKAGVSIGYGLTIIEPPVGFLDSYQMIRNGAGHQITLEAFIKFVDMPWFFAGINVGITLHDYSKSFSYSNMSAVLIGGYPIKLDQILYARALFGINYSPIFSVYTGVGIASLYVIPDMLNKHVMVTIGAEYRPCGRLGIKAEYNIIPNPYNNILGGSPITHFFNFGINFYLV